jgi:hypothetical protein
MTCYADFYSKIRSFSGHLSQFYAIFDENGDLLASLSICAKVFANFSGALITYENLVSLPQEGFWSL